MLNEHQLLIMDVVWVAVLMSAFRVLRRVVPVKCIHYTGITALNIRKRKSKNYWLATHMSSWDLIFYLAPCVSSVKPEHYIHWMHVPRERGSKTWCNTRRNHRKQYQDPERGVKQYAFICLSDYSYMEEEYLFLDFEAPHFL